MNAESALRYLPFGDTALLVEFGDFISLEVNRKVLTLNEALLKAKIRGIEELVPTYRSLLVRYNPLETAYEQLVFRVQDVEKKMEKTTLKIDGQRVTVPVAYGGENGPDLGYVAKHHGLTEKEVVRFHSEREYRVYMLGFIAGFPYLGEVADEIATPRLETPRLKAPAGSVGIAEKQTGIYPREAPGGWRIIGRTPLQLFNPLRLPPALLKAGDTVKFKPISEKALKTLSKKKSTFPVPRSKNRLGILKVLKSGFFTTVQDLGRYGCLKYGVPMSGAMDTFSLAAANLIVGNNPSDACLETTLIGPELEALAKTQIVITGGQTSPTVNGHRVPMWQTLNVAEGDMISFGRMESGCRAYIAVRGGISVPKMLESRSTYARGGFGGLEGRALKTGDTVNGFDVHLLKSSYSMPQELVPPFTDEFKVRVILGPQADMFTERGVETLLSCAYRVTVESDRMGYRLDGPTIEQQGKADIVSDALLPGAIQVPRDGKPIMIMRDAQTTGGYAKIAVAITPDVDLLGQAKPDDVMRFSRITMREAHEKALAYRRQIDGLAAVLVKTT